MQLEARLLAVAPPMPAREEDGPARVEAAAAQPEPSAAPSEPPARVEAAAAQPGHAAVEAPVQLSPMARLMAAMPRSATTVSHSLLPQGMTIDTASGQRRQRVLQSPRGGGAAAAVATGSPLPKRTKHAQAQAVYAEARRAILSEADKRLYWELEPKYCSVAKPDWQAMAAEFNAEAAIRIGKAEGVALDPEGQLTFKSAADLQNHYLAGSRALAVTRALQSSSVGPEPDSQPSSAGPPLPTAEAAWDARQRRMQLMRSGGAGTARARDRALQALTARAAASASQAGAAQVAAAATAAQAAAAFALQPMFPPPPMPWFPAVPAALAAASAALAGVSSAAGPSRADPPESNPGGRGTPHICRRHWSRKDCRAYGVEHVRQGVEGVCMQRGAPLPCGICGKLLSQHMGSCIRPASFEPKPLSQNLCADMRPEA